ncbi:hypothetical protein E2P81_ATG11620 [Venturia nashicola]|uniref:WW domain-containing protein n=1 Tax=Venturia nashicola TaxID=86259 RepID=A0A4Z1NKZ7_9PEZI|nr:hypothetical protein E6O75_ATG11314 [Venturia nashicola]TLD18710.1 hypothetical protein E2P81_ATG11620 [Venturia nashicola]
MAEHTVQDTPAPMNGQETKQQPQDDTATSPPLPDEAPTLPNEDAPPLPDEDAPPLPDEDAPPLPDEAPPLPEEAAPVDDGWDAIMDPNGIWYFWNKYTNVITYENPRVPQASPVANDPATYQSVNSTSSGPPGSESSPVRHKVVAGGYNPAIHGDYDPNADYAQEAHSDDEKLAAPPPNPEAIYAAVGSFNRFTGKWQAGDQGPELHNDENKSKRQMNAFFDVDAAANSHDGRSLKAERQQKKLSKHEVKAFKEKRRAKKEEKRRAWLMD